MKIKFTKKVRCCIDQVSGRDCAKGEELTVADSVGKEIVSAGYAEEVLAPSRSKKAKAKSRKENKSKTPKENKSKKNKK